MTPRTVRWFRHSLSGATLAAFVVSTSAAAQEPVRLKVTYGQVYAVSGMTFAWTTLYVNVKNIAFQKSVVMHYKDQVDGSWKDFPLTHSGYYGNYDVFSGANAPAAQEFVIKYAMPGEEVGDRNVSASYDVD